MLRALVARRRVRKVARMWDAAAKGSREVHAILEAAGADRKLRRRVDNALVKGQGMPAEVAAMVKGGK